MTAEGARGAPLPLQDDRVSGFALVACGYRQRMSEVLDPEEENEEQPEPEPPPEEEPVTAPEPGTFPEEPDVVLPDE